MRPGDRPEDNWLIVFAVLAVVAGTFFIAYGLWLGRR
jgi:hypothetical protein